MQVTRPQFGPCELPPTALLHKYQIGNAYADCFVSEVAGRVTQAQWVEAFYTTRLFKLERSVLQRLASRPSTDLQARQLAEGKLDTFAAWRVEARGENQLLLADFTGRTKSWLMVERVDRDLSEPSTRLYFGSAVLPQTDAKTGKQSLGLLFSALLGFHKLYSRLLVSAATARVAQRKA